MRVFDQMKAISELLRRHDLVGVTSEAPEDEYDGEAVKLYEALQQLRVPEVDEDDVARVPVNIYAALIQSVLAASFNVPVHVNPALTNAARELQLLAKGWWGWG